MTIGEDPNFNAADNVNCPDLASWVAETDANLAAAIRDLETNAPDIFDDGQSILNAVERAAKLAGRREVLDELKDRIANKD